MDAVAVRVAEFLDNAETKINVITGFRATEELLLMKRRFPQSKILLVDADARTRFERHVRRARDPEITSFSEFLQQDEEQRQFGVMRVSAELAEIYIRNEGSVEAFEAKIDEVIGQAISTSLSRLEHRTSGTSIPGELSRCLEALASLRHSSTCEEIAAETGRFGEEVRKYNTNRALKVVPEFAERIEKTGALLSYRITQRGKILLSLLRLLDQTSSRRGRKDTSSDPSPEET